MDRISSLQAKFKVKRCRSSIFLATFEKLKHFSSTFSNDFG